MHENRGVASFIFEGKGKDGEMEGGQEEEETGDQGTHKNVQEAWLYIRALEILLVRERIEKDRKGERKKQTAVPNNLETGMLTKTVNGGVAVDG